MTKFLKMVQF